MADFINPIDKIISNYLLVDLIWEHLTTPEVLQTSLVSLDWWKASRTYLKRNPELAFVRVTGSACRTLKRFDDYLSNVQATICNGIHHSYRRITPYSLMTIDNRNCVNCLAHESSDPINVRDLYRNILTKMKFKYVQFVLSITTTCPLVQLIQLVLDERRDEILELHVIHPRCLSKAVWFPILYRFFFPEEKLPMSFEKLQLLALRGAYLPINLHAPILKKSYLKYSLEIDEDFPLINRSKMVWFIVKDTDSFLRFLKEFKPKTEMLKLGYDYDVPIQNSLSFYMIGQICSRTLVILSCTFEQLVLLTTGDVDDYSTKNTFASLKYVTLYHELSNEIVRWFRLVNFSSVFPRLERAHILIVHHQPEGFTNTMVETDYCAFPGVKYLRIDYCDRDIGRLIVALRLFSQARHVLLKRPDARDTNEASLAAISYEIQNMPQLEELILRSHRPLDWVNIDRLMRIDSSGGLVKVTPNSQEPHSLPLPLLNKPGLKKFTISGNIVCNCSGFRQGTTSLQEYRRNAFGISNSTAALIYKNLPGFILQFEFKGCKCFWSQEGINFDHLNRIANITTSTAVLDGMGPNPWCGVQVFKIEFTGGFVPAFQNAPKDEWSVIWGTDEHEFPIEKRCISI